MASQGWDDTCDVVVVGSGFAGLAAAIEARNAGASVTVIEKTHSLAGNSKMSDGGMAAVDSPKQRERGIEDSVDLFVDDLLSAGGRLNDPKLVRYLGENSWASVEWVQDYLDVPFKDRLSHQGGHSVPRSYHPSGTVGGYTVIRSTLRVLDDLGVTIETNRKLTSLVTDDGGVEGIEIMDGHDPLKGTEGTPRRIETTGVVLATGGFGNDEEMKRVEQPDFDAMQTTNHEWATGDGLWTAVRAGAHPLHLSYIQHLPTTCPDDPTGGTGIGNKFGMWSAPYAIWIDPSTGRRFVNELGGRRERVLAQQRIGDDPEYPLAIADANGVDDVSNLDTLVDRGLVYTFETLDALAFEFDVPGDELHDEIETYNASIARSVDEDFDKPIPDDAAPLATPPWYAMRVWYRTHYTMGGVRINTDAQVIDTNGNPIDNLYAAGEITGGIHGMSRLTSCSVPDCICFGRTAGRMVAGGSRPY